jgi:hypothetical protein
MGRFSQMGWIDFTSHIDVICENLPFPFFLYTY